ncbi:uncharacterized protein [Bemisia tabaci]|uniref:uncharacterized protein isoform X1 n=1 Tax=Bemisia tabaci TaxID=7038 RepID=UPI003B288DE6
MCFMANDPGRLDNLRNGSKEAESEPELWRGANVCEVCNKRFSRRDSLYKHRKMHTGSTQCSICRVNLSRKAHLKRHLLRVHNLVLQENAARGPSPFSVLALTPATDATDVDADASDDEDALRASPRLGHIAV